MNGRTRTLALLFVWMMMSPLMGQIDQPAISLPGSPGEAMKPWVLPYELAHLDTLIERALVHSPLLKSQDAVIEGKAMSREVEALDWLDMGKVFGGVSYGTGQILSLTTDGEVPVNSLANRQSLFYNAGFNLTVSPYDLITREKRLQTIDVDILRSRYDRMVIEERIKEAVIGRYQDLLLAIETQEIRLLNLQNQRLSAELAETFFRNGDILFTEYSGAQEMRIKAELDFISARSNTERAYQLLQSLVGGDIH